jgi:hypothetical protein
MWETKITIDPVVGRKDSDIPRTIDGIPPEVGGQPAVGGVPPIPAIPPMGNIHATWTDESGTFVFEGKSAVDAEGQANFIELATEAHKVWKKKQVADETVTEEFQDRITQTDPLK